MVFRTKLLEKALLFEIPLDHYAYETQNLISKVNAVLDGKIHTSIFISNKLLRELREIKMNLLMGNLLPLEIKTESLIEF